MVRNQIDSNKYYFAKNKISFKLLIEKKMVNRRHNMEFFRRFGTVSLSSDGAFQNAIFNWFGFLLQ